MTARSPVLALGCVLLSALIALVSVASATQDQEVVTANPELAADLPTKENLTTALELLDGSDTGLDAVQLELARSERRQALLDLDLLQSARQQRIDNEAARSAIPEELSAVRAQLAETSPVLPSIDPNLSTEDLEGLLASAQAELSAHRERLEGHRGTTASNVVTRTELPTQISELEAELLAVAVPLPLEEGLPARLRNAVLDARQVERARVEAELGAKRARLEYLVQIEELNNLRTQLLERRLDRAREAERIYSSELETRRKQESERVAQAAQRQIERAGYWLEPLAEEIALLAEENNQLTARSAVVGTEKDRLESELSNLKRRFESTRKKVDTVGLDNLMGILLRQERSRLPDADKVRVQLRAHQKANALRQLRQSEVEDELALLETTSLAMLASEYLAQRIELDRSKEEPVGFDEGERPTLQAEAESYLGQQIDALVRVKSTLSELTLELAELQVAEKLYIEQAETYSQYINERVLWVRSAAALWSWEVSDRVDARDRLLARRTGDLELEPANQLRDLLGAGAWLFSPIEWGNVLNCLARDSRAAPVAWSLGGLLVLGLLWVRRPLRQHLDLMAEGSSGRIMSSYKLLATTLGITMLLAAAYPALVWLLGTRVVAGLAFLEGDQHLLRGLAVHLPKLALLLFALEFVQRCFRPNGLAIVHLEWTPERARRLRRSLILFTWPFLVAHLAVGLLEGHPSDGYSATLGRLIFVPQMLWLALFAWGFVRSSHPRVDKDEDEPAPRVDEHEGRPFLRRLAQVWMWTALLAPLALSGLSIAGFHFTARQLLGSLLLTLALLAALYLAQSVSLRMVELTKRRLAVQRLRRSFEKRRKSLSGSEAGDEPEFEEPPANLSEVSSQVRQLVATAFGLAGLISISLIWIDVIPALGIFREVDLWSVDGVEALLPPSTSPDGTAAAVTTTSRVTVTLADLLLAIFVGIVTFASARRIPALLDILIFERLHLSGGERYAYTTVVSYVITMVGVIVSLSMIRIGWNQVQFLAAAISVGLGFGLQEIFANFVSGLILLFERPIRLGDWVTIGNTTGQVTRIRIRATTILDRERKELIVPNKEFVTGQLTNWTLSDAVTRTSVAVGVAYGSNVDLARKTLLEVASKTKGVLSQPAPTARFVSFGESALDLRLDVFIPDQQRLLEIITDLHLGIDRAFREKEIEISFPQRDLHIRSVPPGFAVAKQADAEQSHPNR